MTDPAAAEHGGPGADRLIAAMFVFVTQLEVWGRFTEGEIGLGQTIIAAVLVALASGALAWRRSRPATSYFVNGVLMYVLIAMGQPSSAYQFTNLVATYSVAAHATNRQALAALPFSLVGVFAFFARFMGLGAILAAGFAATGWLAAWLAGRNTRIAGRERQARAERDASLQVAAADRRRLELEEERARIARELHDSIGHGVNVMVLHAGAGRAALERDPATTRETLATIERTGREALEELDRLLALLRDDDADAMLAPAPGIDQVAALAEAVRAAGLPVDLAVEGPVADVPDAVGLHVHRIVQEATTNVLRHARASRVDVRVAVKPDLVEVRVTDDGIGTHGLREGRGIRGMRERVALHDGSLDLADADPGTAVTAVLRWEDRR